MKTNKYKFPSDWHLIKEDFKEQFKLSIIDFYEPLISWMQQKFTINVIRLDEYLHGKYGEYEEKGLSMEDIIREHYGPKGVKLLNELI